MTRRRLLKLIPAPAAGDQTISPALLTGSASFGAVSHTLTPALLTGSASIPTPSVTTVAAADNVRLEMEFSADVWTDINADVLEKHPVRSRRGIFGSGPSDLVASPGTLTFVLNNMANNSGGLQGYYTPGHANVRAGFDFGTRVRFYIDSGFSNSRYVFLGKLSVIQPTPGTTGTQETSCLAVDWMDDFGRYDRPHLDLAGQAGARSDELISDLIALVDAPENQSIATGIDRYEYAWDDIGEGATNTQLANDICQSERGYFFVRGNTTDGETVVFENRHTRITTASSQTFAASELKYDGGIEVPSALDRLVNVVETRIKRRRIDGAAVVLATAERALFIPPDNPIGAGVLVAHVEYKDPTDEAELIGGTNFEAWTQYTDWTMNTKEDGSGSDHDGIPGTQTLSAKGSTATITIANALPIDSFWLRGPGSSGGPFPNAGFQIRGRGVYSYAAVLLKAENETSTAAYGRRQLPSPLSMPYQSNMNMAQGIADWIVAIWGDLPNTPTRIRPVTEVAGTLDKALAVDIGSRITVSEAVTAVSSVEVTINAVEIEARGQTVSIWFTVTPVDTSDYFILDDATKGKLDNVTYKLGYA